MQINFASALHVLRSARGGDFAFQIANATRPPSDYLLNQVLPERNINDWAVKSGRLTIRPTMAGLVGMDSPYPPVGAAEISTFLEQTAKFAAKVRFTEQMLRELITFAREVSDAGGSVPQAVAETILNFTNTMLVQPHLDTFEYLRGEALSYGAIDWTFNQKRLQVDYGIPAGHIMPQRTGTSHYGGSASFFWSDLRYAQSELKNRVRVRIAHPDTINLVISNTVNNIEVTAQDAFGSVEISRLVTIGGNTVRSSDARDRVRIIAHAGEGEILDPANPGSTIKVKFVPLGKIINIGDPVPRGFMVGQGAVPENPQNSVEIGYTHIAPTIEGNGRTGRWANVYTPENEPYQLEGRSVTNGLPVIEGYDKLVVMDTAMA